MSNFRINSRHNRKIVIGERLSCAIRALEINGGKIMKGGWVKVVLPLVGAMEAVTESGERRQRIVDNGGVRMEKVSVSEELSMTSGWACCWKPSRATKVVVDIVEYRPSGVGYEGV